MKKLITNSVALISTNKFAELSTTYPYSSKNGRGLNLKDHINIASRENISNP